MHKVAQITYSNIHYSQLKKLRLKTFTIT